MVRTKVYTVPVRFTKEEERYVRECAARLRLSISAFIALEATRPLRNKNETVSGKMVASDDE